jgi:hypothetical protein
MGSKGKPKAGGQEQPNAVQGPRMVKVKVKLDLNQLEKLYRKQQGKPAGKPKAGGGNKKKK